MGEPLRREIGSGRRTSGGGAKRLRRASASRRKIANSRGEEPWRCERFNARRRRKATPAGQRVAQEKQRIAAARSRGVMSVVTPGEDAACVFGGPKKEEQPGGDGCSMVPHAFRLSNNRSFNRRIYCTPWRGRSGVA